MSENPTKPKKSKNASAREIAEIMAENMAANMKDPEKFWKEHDALEEEVRLRALEKRKLQREQEQK